MGTFFIYIIAYVLSIFFGFCSLWVVDKFSVEHTIVKNLFIGAVIIETTSFVLALLKIPFGDMLLIAVGMVVLAKITSIRGMHLFFAMLLYGLVKTVGFMTLDIFLN